MNNSILWKILFAASMILSAYLIFYSLKAKDSYPVEFLVCDSGYNDCDEVARFRNRFDCEATSEKWQWYCSSIDKQDIRCREPKPGESAATGVCR